MSPDLINDLRSIANWLSGWTVMALALAYRLLLIPAIAAFTDGDDVLDLNLDEKYPAQEVSNVEFLLAQLKLWTAVLGAASVFFFLSMGSDIIRIAHHSVVLASVITTICLLPILACSLSYVSSTDGSPADYTIEGDRAAIQKRWDKQIRLAAWARRICYIWAGCMFLLSVTLQFITRR